MKHIKTDNMMYSTTTYYPIFYTKFELLGGA